MSGFVISKIALHWKKLSIKRGFCRLITMLKDDNHCHEKDDPVYSIAYLYQAVGQSAFLCIGA